MFQYLTSPDFRAGAFGLTRFRVLSDGTYAYAGIVTRMTKIS